MKKPIQVSAHKQMTIDRVEDELHFRLLYNTVKDPEFKPAKGGFNMQLDQKQLKRMIKTLKQFVEE
jgi:hypothetical protein